MLSRPLQFLFVDILIICAVLITLHVKVWVRYIHVWLRNQYFAGFSSPLKIKNVNKPYIRFFHRYIIQ